jgi:hypothetical protein
MTGLKLKGSYVELVRQYFVNNLKSLTDETQKRMSCCLPLIVEAMRGFRLL